MASEKVTASHLLTVDLSRRPGLEEYLTDPAHGGKITCRVCGGFIDSNQRYIKRGDTYEHLNSQGPECAGARA